jgi:hemerythrin-like metal-binding protein
MPKSIDLRQGGHDVRGLNYTFRVVWKSKRAFAMTGPSLVLGIEMMDADHLRIERLLGEIATASDGDIARLFTDLDAELSAHFAREEELMKAKSFPGLHCHVAQHNNILDQLRRGAQLTDAAALREHLVTLVPQLVQSHVFTLDRMTAAFLKGEFDRSVFDPLRLPVEQRAV